MRSRYAFICRVNTLTRVIKRIAVSQMNVKQTQKASQPVKKRPAINTMMSPQFKWKRKCTKRTIQEIKREGRKKICIVLCVSPECKMKMKNANEKANENQMECLIANERAEE